MSVRLPNWIDYLLAMARESQRPLERTHLLSFVAHLLLAGAFGTVLAFLESVPLGVMGSVLFLLIVWLVVTPSRIWREQREKILVLEDQERKNALAVEEALRPKLQVTIDVERKSPGDVGIFLRLRVHNSGHATAIACYGKLVEVRPRTPTHERMPEAGQNLRWSTRGGCAGAFTCDVNAKSSEFLDVAFTGTSPRVEPTRFAFSTNAPWDWPIDAGEYDLEIEVGSSNVATPTTGSYRIVYRGGLDLAWIS